MTSDAISFLLQLSFAAVLGIGLAVRGIRRPRTRVRLLKH